MVYSPLGPVPSAQDPLIGMVELWFSLVSYGELGAVMEVVCFRSYKIKCDTMPCFLPTVP